MSTILTAKFGALLKIERVIPPRLLLMFLAIVVASLDGSTTIWM